MKRLLRIAFSKKIHRVLLTFTLVFALGYTLFTQLEIYSLGIITKKGPDFFELFGSTRQQSSVTHDELLSTWQKLDADEKGFVDRSDVQHFQEKRPNKGFVDQGIIFIKKWLPLDQSIWALVGFLTLVSIFKALTLFFYRFGTRLFTINICKDVRQQYFEHIQSLPMSFYQNYNIGALTSRAINDTYIIADGIHSALVNYLQTPFALISTLSVCFYISWQLSCIIFFGLPVFVLPIIFIARRIRRLSRKLQQKQEDFASVLIEFLRGIQTIKLYAMEQFSLIKYQENNDAMASLETRNARYDTSLRPLLHTIGMLFLVTVLIFGLYVLKLPLHEILVFCGLLIVAYEPIKKFGEENGRIQRGAAACDRLHEILDIQPSIVDEKGAQDTVVFNEKIAFHDVTFSYGHTNVLSSLSFEVHKGEVVAIVGPTGGGKSTIISLCARLFEPQKGSITIDGESITQFSQKALRDFFSVVPQKPFLFHDTVQANICFGQNFSNADVHRAARQAHAEEFISKLPHGYDTILSEAGKTLSGGQQQRLALARAMIKKSPILILDEATSSLDSVSEFHIKTMLNELKGEITQIIIAHRFSTIESADRIIVIENGQKVGDGTKEDLLKTCPTFQRLWMPHIQSYSSSPCNTDKKQESQQVLL